MKNPFPFVALSVEKSPLFFFYQNKNKTGGKMKYILVKQEDFDKLDADIVEDRSIKDYRFSWDANGLYFIFWSEIMNFFEENSIPYEVVKK